MWTPRPGPPGPARVPHPELTYKPGLLGDSLSQRPAPSALPPRQEATSTRFATASTGPSCPPQEPSQPQRGLAFSASRSQHPAGSNGWRPRPDSPLPPSAPHPHLTRRPNLNAASPSRRPTPIPELGPTGGDPDPINTSSTGPLLHPRPASKAHSWHATSALCFKHPAKFPSNILHLQRVSFN